METPIYNSNQTSNPQTFPAIIQAAEFLQDIDNTRKKWRGLSYPEVFLLVKTFVQALDPERDLENISVENLISLLNSLLAEKTNIESVIPPELQIILEEYEAAKTEAEFYKRRASQKAKDYIEKVQAQTEFRKKLAPFRKAVANITSGFENKLSEGVAPEKQSIIATVIAEELPIQEGIELSLKKASNLPPELREAKEKQITDNLTQSYQETAPIFVDKLKTRGIEISPEELKVITRIPLTSNFSFSAQQLAKPVSERQEFRNWIEKQLSPVTSPANAQQISQVLVPAILNKLPEMDPGILSKLSEKDLSELKTQVEEAVLVAIAEVGPELGEIPPEKLPRLVASFIPQNKQELEKFVPILTITKESRIVLQPPALTETIHVTQLPAKGPFLFASPLKRASVGNIWQTRENKERFVDQIRRQLYQEGLNQSSTLEFKNKTFEYLALYLTSQKITPEDITFTIDQLAKAGENLDSPRIKELTEVKNSLSSFQQQYSTGFINKIKKEGQIEGQKGNRVVQLPSRFGTVIVRQVEFNPKRSLSTMINFLAGKLFGQKTVVVGQNQVLVINKLAFQTSRFFTSLKAGFFKTSFGRGFQIGLQKLSQKSLQALFDTAKIGAKQIIKTGVKVILNTLGIAVSAGLLNVITEVLPKVASLIKKGFKSIATFFGNFLSGLTGQREVEENKDLAWVKPLLVIFFILLLFLGVFQMNVISGSFVQPFSTRYVGPFPPEAIQPTCLNLVDIFKQKAQEQCVPAGLLMAISRMEASGIWSLSCEQVAKFSTDRWWDQATEDEKNTAYCYDTCARTGLCSGTTVMGPMQFEERTWSGFMPSYSLMDRCRIDLSLEAAAKKIKANSGTDTNNCNNWDETTVRHVAYRYCGSCGTEGCRLNPDTNDSCSNACGVDYCSGVWYLYQQYASQ